MDEFNAGNGIMSRVGPPFLGAYQQPKKSILQLLPGISNKDK
jgi:hypothetical protein